MVVALGLTACVPPVADKVYELLSVPVIVTWVALVAVTVRMDEAPALMALGFAMMLTVGCGAAAALTETDAVAFAEPPGPVAVAV